MMTSYLLGELSRDLNICLINDLIIIKVLDFCSGILKQQFVKSCFSSDKFKYLYSKVIITKSEMIELTSNDQQLLEPTHCSGDADPILHLT